MVHRGPDDEGVHVDSAAGVALGARRLSIIDIEGGHQPLANEDGSLWAVLNGEIYNHRALRSTLSAQGHVFKSTTDTEILVHLYEQRGRAMLDALDGMFAFALWDARGRRLLVARDRFGEKPLFYQEQAGVLSFASELTALSAPQSIPGDLDPAAVDDFFVFGYVGSPRSIVAGVRQLEPGTTLQWTPTGGTELERYWSPPAPPELDITMPELVAESRRLLTESVRTRLMADVPVGIFLSGGVDSALVSALAVENSRDRIKTFTVGYDVGNVDEAATARAVAAQLGTDHHEVLLTEDQVRTGVPQMLRSMDQPVADQALVALHTVATMARPQVTVALGGEGADELFAGYPRYRWLRRAARMSRAIPAGAGRALESLATTASNSSRAQRLGRIASGASPLELHVDWVTAGRRALRDSLYGPQLSSSLDPSRVVRDLESKIEWNAFSDPAQAYMALDQSHWLPNDVLPKADRASMLVSLEMRTPFLHHPLAELTAAVPAGMHLQGGGKAALRAILREVAPDLDQRRKTAFRVPAADWLRGPLAGVLDDQVNHGALYHGGWFDRAAVRKLRDAHAAGQDRSHALWPLLALGLWLDGWQDRA